MDCTRPKKRMNRWFRTFPSRVDEKSVESTWSKVQNAVEKILQKNCSCLSFEEIYRCAYNMVIFEQDERLYDGVREIVLAHLETEVLNSVLGSLDHGFLRMLNECWTDYRTAMVMIRDVLLYADKTNRKCYKEDSVYNLGLVLFRDVVVRHDLVRKRLLETLLDMVTHERNGETIDRIALRTACQMLVAIGIQNRIIYQVDFEIPFLEQSAEFYKAESLKLLAENSAITYLKKAEYRIHEEAERAKNCLDVSTESRIIAVTEEELIRKRMKSIVEMENSGVVYMLKNERMQDLYFMYKLLSKYPDGMKIMSTYLNKYIRDECQLLIKRDDTALNPVTYIQSLLDFNDKLECFLCNMFINDKTFKEATLEFNHFLVFNPNLPRYIALFIDEKLRKGIRAIDENSLEIVLDKAMVLFRHLQDKDVFETYYRQYLAKRVLLKKYMSEDNEKNMISKLKTECGCQYTSKLEAMFKDMSLSNTIIHSFKESNASSSNIDGIDLTVRVLTTRVWPLPKVPPKCILPRKALMAFEKFRTFYLDKHSGRQLRLQPLLGSADISAVFYYNHRDNNAISSKDSTVGSTFDSSMANNGNSKFERKHLFQVSTYQMAILMLFNSYEKMTMEMIMNETNINAKDLTRALQSLSMGKPAHRILLKCPETKEIEPHHEFSVNESYNSKMYRVRIKSIVTIGENELDQFYTKDHVNEDRKRKIETVILRIMKAHKNLTHSSLTMKVTEQLRSRFMPSPVQIKKCIECLIEENRLARSEINRFTYTYVEAEQEFITPEKSIDNSSHYTQLWNFKEVVYGVFPISPP